MNTDASLTSPRGERSRPLPGLVPAAALAGACLLAGGCANVPPFVDRHYVGTALVQLTERIGGNGADETEPLPGLSLTAGTLIEVKGDRVTALEAEIQYFTLRGLSDVDGYGLRYFAGGRRTWNTGGRIRPNLGAGLFVTDFHLDDLNADFDPIGIGAYSDLGLDWMVTEGHSIGCRLRGGLRYEEAHHDHGLKPSIEFALQSKWRF